MILLNLTINVKNIKSSQKTQIRNLTETVPIKYNTPSQYFPCHIEKYCIHSIESCICIFSKRITLFFNWTVYHIKSYLERTTFLPTSKIQNIHSNKAENIYKLR